MVEQVAGKSLSGVCLRNLRCKMLILGRDIVWSMTLKSCPGYISETERYRKLILGRDIGKGIEVCSFMF